MRIELLGTSFTIHTDEDPERLRDIVDYYKTKVQEIRGSVSTTDSLKIAILAGLLSVDEVFKAREAGGTDDTDADTVDQGLGGGEAEEIGAIAENLIDALDSSLEE